MRATLGRQINVVEYDDKLVFSNKGSFIPGNIERVLINDAPEEKYRNQRLASAMVGLKMVDTIGSGIRKMYNYQRQRLFPLPDYNLADNRIEVTITGKILDMNYANILAGNPDLNLLDIELQNRLQLRKSLSDEEIAGSTRRQTKKDKITNLLTKLRKLGKIKNKSQRPNSNWLII